MTNEELLRKIGAWKDESEGLMSTYHDRFQKNMKLVRGIFNDDKPSLSKVRKRHRIFYRKIWTTIWRILASFYAAFLRDPDSVNIEGRDTKFDPVRAEVLLQMIYYRRDRMFRSQSLFIKMLWALYNALECGWTVGKLCWNYNEDLGIDEPCFTLYPNEQVFPDLSAETKENMRFIIFESYLTREDCEEMGYKNLDEAELTSIPYNEVRATRYMNERDPLLGTVRSNDYGFPRGGEYRRPGKGMTPEQDEILKRYIVWETFYRKDGKWRLVITNKQKAILQDDMESPYGDRLPVVMGTVLTRPHKMIGEGFPEPLEGPQESLNATLNQRKDNVSLVLNRQTIVSRYGNVDLASLMNSRAGGITLADDPNAVKEREIQDVTASAYMEAQSDEMVMQEMGGTPDIKQGKERAEKATVAQLNYSESNAKIDLFIAIIAETFFKDFYSTLGWLIQKFETDENIFRIANAKAAETLRKDAGEADVYHVDFEADIIVNVGMGTVGRDVEIRNTLMAMDRAIMANQSMAQILQLGVYPPEGLKIFNPVAFMEDILPKLGKKNIEKYFIEIPPPQPQPDTMASNRVNQYQQGIRGRTQPQVGNTGPPTGILSGAEGAM